jgi:hypothetical protein
LGQPAPRPHLSPTWASSRPRRCIARGCWAASWTAACATPTSSCAWAFPSGTPSTHPGTWWATGCPPPRTSPSIRRRPGPPGRLAPRRPGRHGPHPRRARG